MQPFSSGLSSAAGSTTRGPVKYHQRNRGQKQGGKNELLAELVAYLGGCPAAARRRRSRTAGQRRSLPPRPTERTLLGPENAFCRLPERDVFKAVSQRRSIRSRPHRKGKAAPRLCYRRLSAQQVRAGGCPAGRWPGVTVPLRGAALRLGRSRPWCLLSQPARVRRRAQQSRSARSPQSRSAGRAADGSLQVVTRREVVGANS